MGKANFLDAEPNPNLPPCPICEGKGVKKDKYGSERTCRWCKGGGRVRDERILARNRRLKQLRKY